MLHRTFLKERFREMRKQAEAGLPQATGLSPEFMAGHAERQQAHEADAAKNDAIESAVVAAKHEALAKISKAESDIKVKKITSKIKKADKELQDAEKAEAEAAAQQNAPPEAPPTSMPGAPPVG